MTIKQQQVAVNFSKSICNMLPISSATVTNNELVLVVESKYILPVLFFLRNHILLRFLIYLGQFQQK